MQEEALVSDGAEERRRITKSKPDELDAVIMF
jgi:hypothetical protein